MSAFAILASSMLFVLTLSIASNKLCLRCSIVSVCGPRKSFTRSVNRVLSASSVACACIRKSVSCACSSLIRALCASSQALYALVVLPPKSPSLVTPITA